MDVREFIQKWRNVTLNERSASQEHFLDLCHVLNHPTPAEADPEGTWFRFERNVEVQGGGLGRADVWKRGFFGWGYKGLHKDLDAAYNQLLKYYEALEQPPLLVVCDMQRFIVHTKFNNAVSKTYEFTVEQLDQPSVLGMLDAVFKDPKQLHPNERPDQLTGKAAEKFAELAESLRKDHPPRKVAHFLTQVVFTLFAEDIGLLPRGPSGQRIFSEAIRANQGERYVYFPEYTRRLFATMATGGDLQYQAVAHFNGGLFVANDEPWVPTLGVEEMATLLAAAELDWSAVEPSIFGTLFERGLDPEKRSQLGAHYTSRDDIVAIVEPVLMWPLRREWEAIQADLTPALTSPGPSGHPLHPVPRGDRTGSERAAHNSVAGSEMVPHLMGVRDGFLGKLAGMRVLDPACGSGNFLYVSLNLMKDLEKQVIQHPAFESLPPAEPRVSPAQLYGIELSEYAHELASVVVWIGYIQWHKNNGYTYSQKPILQKLNNIQNMDAVLGVAEDGTLYKPEWPEVEVIVGNPPFLGGNRIRQELGDQTVEDLFTLYDIPNFSDLCCYWFERAREQIADDRATRVGLLATQAVRGGVNRAVLERIKESGDIFFAYSDRPWVLDGAAVRVSMVGFDGAHETQRTLDDVGVSVIYSNLTADVGLPEAKLLSENTNIAYKGPSPNAPWLNYRKSEKRRATR